MYMFLITATFKKDIYFNILFRNSNMYCMYVHVYSIYKNYSSSLTKRISLVVELKAMTVPYSLSLQITQAIRLVHIV